MMQDQAIFIIAAEHAKREAMLNFYLNNPASHQVFMTILARNPKDGSLLFDVPADRVTQEGMLILNVMPDAVGHFAMTPQETVVDVRFNGKPHRLMFSSSLIFALTALPASGKPLHSTQFPVDVFGPATAATGEAADIGRAEGDAPQAERPRPNLRVVH